MLAFTRALLAMRRRTPALQTGQTVLRGVADGVLAFERRLGDAGRLCLFELSGTARLVAGRELPAFVHSIEPL